MRSMVRAVLLPCVLAACSTAPPPAALPPAPPPAASQQLAAAPAALRVEVSLSQPLAATAALATLAGREPPRGSGDTLWPQASAALVEMRPDLARTFLRRLDAAKAPASARL